MDDILEEILDDINSKDIEKYKLEMVMIRAESDNKKEAPSSTKKRGIVAKSHNDTQTVKKRLKSMSLYTTKYKPVDTSEKR